MTTATESWAERHPSLAVYTAVGVLALIVLQILELLGIL